MTHDDTTLDLLERLNHGPMVFFKWKADQHRTVLAVTGNVETLCGYSTMQLINGMHFDEIVHPDDRPRVKAETLASSENGQFRISPYRIIHRDGSIRWVNEYSCVEYEGKKPSFFYGYLSDITSQKHNMEALMVDSLKYRSFFEKHSSIFLLVDPVNGHIVKANRAASEFYGYSIEELEQMTITQINVLEPEEIKRRMDEADRLRRNYFIFPHRLASGEVRTVEVHSTPARIFDRDYLFSIVHDITERVRLETELKELNQDLQRRVDSEIQRRADILRRYQLLFERAGEAVFIIQDSVYLDANDAALRLFGLDDRSQLIGRHPHDFAPPLQTDGQSSEARVKQILQKAEEQGRQQLTFLHRKADGTDILVRIDLSRIDLDDGHVLYALCQDITEEEEEKKKEEAARRLVLQQARVSAMEEMLGTIADQWKQPLNAVSLMVQYLSELRQNGNLTPDSIDPIINDATRQLEFMARTIDDFHALFRSQGAQDETTFSVRPLIQEATEILAGRMADLTVEVAGGDFKITGSPNRFRQAIQKLLNNARDAIYKRLATDPDTQGRILIDIDDHLRKIDILDNGGGIAEDIADRIFEPYSSAKPIEDGHGPGLYLVKIVIESMRGGIHHHNRQEGACMTLQF